MLIGSAMDQAGWEAHFRSLAAAGRVPGDPDPRVKELVDVYAPSGSAKRALDLACGSGGNALWLAKQGWTVTAIDQSSAAIDLVQSEAARRGLSVATRVADLETHEFTIQPASWDLIVMCRYLQTDLFESARLALAPGGVLIVIALLADPAVERPQRFRLQPGELGSHFRDVPGFTIVHERENITAPNSFSQRQAFAEIAVQRNSR